MELVNPVDVTEVEPWLAALATTLLGNPWDDEFAKRVDRWRRSWLAERTWGMRDQGRWVATLATDPLTITVPGPSGSTVDVMTDALTAVTVAATHRRRGALSQMIGQSLQAAVERGDALAILIAAEWPIYGRFGYAPATRAAEYTFAIRRAGAGISADPAGSVRQVDTVEMAKYAGDIFDRAWRRWVGQVDRPGLWWSRRLGVDGFEPISDGRGHWILHESEDGPDGFLAWKVGRDFELLDGDLGTVSVLEFVAASDLAYRNLWAYLSGLDVIDKVELHERPIDEPIRWLLQDGRALRQSFAGDHTWLRLLDVPAALGVRGYAAPGEVVLEVVDPAPGGYAAGRYLLDAGPDGASCTPTTRSADLVLPQRTLAGIYLGDHALRTLAYAGGVEELTPGALARTEAMFAAATPPWNSTGF
jgi:predicted acetyltransferase